MSHKMNLVKTFETGAELWRCSVCSHEIVIQWGNHWKRIVLTEGDVNETHSAMKGGLSMEAEVTQEEHLSDKWLDEWGKKLDT